MDFRPPSTSTWLRWIVAKVAKDAPPRKHHFVPQFYLRGLAPPEERRLAIRAGRACAVNGGGQAVIATLAVRRTRERFEATDNLFQPYGHGRSTLGPFALCVAK